MDRPFKKNFNNNRRGGGGFRRFGGPREMHKTTCAECGKECEVPFKPKGDRPVYCRECFLKRQGIAPRETEKPVEKPEQSEASEEARKIAEQSEAKTEEAKEEVKEEETSEAKPAE